MPALPNPLDLPVDRVANITKELVPLQVVCAFPVSGQYGAGSRILYYVLVAALILARRAQWLVNACLAAALVFPAIAAIHGIVLTALHRDGAVDLDIYGALQLCSIGVLTAPTTVRLSKTYFENKGRSILFVWSVLVLAGLIALAVEFFRIQSSPCTDDGSGQPIYRGSNFPYGETTCGLVCSVEEGPFSPMRAGSADNISVVPTPNTFGFGAATLVAAACCIPCVLSMVSTWNKILKANWAKQFGMSEPDEVIEGTNGATVKGMKSVNDVIRRLLGVVEVPVFGGAVLALIIVGERNFWSGPMIWETEPFANVSQWSGLAGAVFAACGSLYMLMAEYLDSAQNGSPPAHPPGPCGCPCHDHGTNSHPNSLSEYHETSEIVRPPAPARTSEGDVNVSSRDTAPFHHLTVTRTETYPDTIHSGHGLGIRTMDSGASTTANDGGVAGALIKFAAGLGTASPERFDDYAFWQGKATGFPEVPGEGNRNRKLPQIKQQWAELSPDDDDGLTPRGRRSRANSFGGISRSNSIGPRAPSPHPQTPTQPAASGPSLLGLPTSASPESTSDSIFPVRPSAELDKTRSQNTVVTLHEGLNSPAIVLSSEDEPEATPADAATPPSEPGVGPGPATDLPPSTRAQQ